MRTSGRRADAAVPSWHEGYREMPFVFVASAASAAAGLCLDAAPIAETPPVRRLGAVSAAAELALGEVMEKRMGLPAECYRRGRAGLLACAGQAATALGAVGALAGRFDRRILRAGGAALLVGSACTRFGIFHAGIASAEDPTYTVAPQRARLRAERGRTVGSPPVLEGSWR